MQSVFRKITTRAVVLTAESGTPLALLSLLSDSRMNISQIDGTRKTPWGTQGQRTGSNGDRG